MNVVKKFKEEKEDTNLKKEKKPKVKREEEIRKHEMKVFRGENLPSSPSDFEKLILGSPNSSVIWIRYMAYHISLHQINQARAIAERAIKQIFYREEKEKLNIWISYLNLESIWGTPEEFDKLLEEAKKLCDPKSILYKAAEICEISNNFEKAIELYSKITNKYKTDIIGWEKLGVCYLKNNERTEFLKIQKISLKILGKKDYATLLSKFAMAEYKIGDPVKGQELFESLLSNNPKRVDIWNIYLDSELKLNQNLKLIRQIFDRAISLKITSKKMKNFFTRYLNFEREFGTQSRVEYVRQKALSYVSSRDEEDES